MKSESRKLSFFLSLIAYSVCYRDMETHTLRIVTFLQLGLEYAEQHILHRMIYYLFSSTILIHESTKTFISLSVI